MQFFESFSEKTDLIFAGPCILIFSDNIFLTKAFNLICLLSASSFRDLSGSYSISILSCVLFFHISILLLISEKNITNLFFVFNNILVMMITIFNLVPY